MSKATAPAANEDFGQILQLIQRTRQAVFAQANTALMELYWQVGKTISEKVASEAWGKGVVKSLADYIARADPAAKASATRTSGA